MPKRRLGYSEVAMETKAPPPSQTRRSSPAPATETSGPASRRSSSRRKSSDFLLKLSRSCNAHATNCHKDRIARPVGLEDEVERIPDQCRADLEQLRNLLPEIEKKFQPPAPGQRGPEAHDVAHLCDFYNSVMQGNYCPYAPHLFDLGKSPKNVIGRVHFLFRHLVSPAVVSTAKKEAVCSDLGPESSQPVLRTLSDTIAHLLSFLIVSSVRSTILLDLVNLLQDCAFLFEDQTVLPVKLSLFTETCDESSSINLDCCLDIHHWDQLWILQTATLMALSTFMMDIRAKALQPQAALTPEIDHHCPSRIPSGWADLEVWTPDHLFRGETISALVSSIRSIMLLESCPTRVARTLFLQGKVAAATMLHHILCDWSRLAPSMCSFVESSMLVAQAIKVSMTKASDQPTAYLSQLGDLLRRVIVDPPNINGRPFTMETPVSSGMPVLPLLLDCLPIINQKEVSFRNFLDAMVLMAISMLLHQGGSTTINNAVAHCLSHGIIPSLLGITQQDPRLSNHASTILVILFCEIATPNEINSICHSAVKAHEKDLAEKDDTKSTIAMITDNTAGIGSKRKRESATKPASNNSSSPIRALELSSSPWTTSGRDLSFPEGSQVTFQSWIVVLRSMLQKGMDAAVKMVEEAVDFGKDPSTSESAQKEQKSLVNARTVAGTLRLVSRMIAHYLSVDAKVDTLSSLFDVGQRLLGTIKGASSNLSPIPHDSVGELEREFHQIIIDCGLDLHYSIANQLLEPKHAYVRNVLELLVTWSTFARQLLLDETSFNIPGIHVFCPSASLVLILSVFGSETKPSGKDSFFAWRSAFFRRYESSDVLSASDFLRPLVSLELVSALPFGARCCLLSSLYPEGCALGDTLRTAGDPREMNSIFKALLNQELKDSAAVFVLFLPLCLSSFARSTSDAPDKKFLDFCMQILVDFLVPLTDTPFQDHTTMCRALLYAAGKIQEIATLSITSVATASPRFDALATLNELSTTAMGPVFAPGYEVPNLQLEIQAKRFVNLLAKKIPEDHSDDVVRKLRWFCMAKLASRSSRTEIREGTLVTTDSFRVDKTPTKGTETSELRSQSWLMWLLEAPFLENNHQFREETSRVLWRLLLGKNDCFLLAHFCSDDIIQTIAACSRSGKAARASTQTSYEVEHAAENLVSEFFRDIDKLLHSSIGVSDSQLSFTMANSGSAQATSKNQRSQANKFSTESTAVKVLASFCRHADSNTPIGKFFFEKAFQRLVRIWAATTFDRTDDLSFSSSKALAFAELSNIAGQQFGRGGLWWQQSDQFTATIISDILVLNCNASRETQFSQLESFVRRIITKDINETLVNTRTLKATRSFIEESLPAFITQFIEEKSMELLRLTPALRQFIEERVRRARKHPTGEPRVVGRSNAPDRWRYNSINARTDDLEKQTKKLCLDNKFLDRILPLVFMRMDRSGLSFFTKEVLKGATLSGLIKNRDQMILKGLVWELGRDSGSIGSAKMGIRAAAAARIIDKKAGSSSEPDANRTPTAEIEVGKLWVTSHFMYLLVSVVQSRWKARTLMDRLHAVRCLYGLLDFLVAQEAPQYFPQIMATVNASILDGDGENCVSDEDRSNARTLRLYAVEALSKFVRLVADVQLETIASNLTTIVVALLPVLDEQDNESMVRNEKSEARDVAVSLLDFLTAGDLGRALAEHFKEIPFLPTSQSLEKVHRSLRSNGVDFDNLAVLSTVSQHCTAVGRDYSMDVSETMGTASLIDTEKVLALQKRLSLICALLENEITSVRKIALQHLTDLLRGNRGTFHTLVRNEGLLSGKRFLTITYKDEVGNPKWASRGEVTAMMERLLARCVAESDEEVRLRLATCLGEVGAISETILGELTIGGSMGDEAIDSPTSSYKWRLEQPPWRSQEVKYELQLVTRQLVVALKAAPSSTDQHKIAFAIQQLLHLLNTYGKQSESEGQEVVSTVGKETMTNWLKETLEQSGQYELIEPYFSSDFKEKSAEGYSTKKPPFVKISAGYFTWVSSFCRWMIQGSKNSDLSPWKNFFFACRTAIRTEAGLNVAEFIIPLLVLDRICFGTSEDRLLLREELAEVLRVETKVYMEAADRQRAVNVVFTTIDTLQVWSDRETEERSRGRSSTSTSSKIRRQLSSKSLVESSSRNWPAEDSIERITELLKSISLDLQARAAQAFGMNARALQRLELEARENTTLQIFEKSAQEQKKDTLNGEKGILQTFGIPEAESFDIELMKNVLSRLDDCETMAAIRKDSLFFNPLQQIRDNIREKQASDDYESALQEYERALQASGSQDRDQSFVKGSLRCLMELGRYESVLNQVAGLQRNKHSDGSLDVVPEASAFAVEAAWKLGRWQTLAEVLDEKMEKPIVECSDAYQIFTGKALLGLYRHDSSTVDSAIRSARDNVMQNLSSAARESYARSYNEIVMLQSLREIENANGLFSIDGIGRFDLDEIAYSLAMDGWSWKGRVDVVTSHGALSVIGTRVALARLHSDPVLVGSLFLESGHRARKNKLWAISENLLSQARAAVADLKDGKLAGNPKLFHLVYSSQVQLAKLKYASGECAVALKILGQQVVDRAIFEMLPNIERPDILAKLATTCEKRLVIEFSGMSASDYEDDQKLVKRFAGRLLQLTRWVSESGLQGGSEIMGRFQLIQKLAPEWEKGQFHFGKFVDSLLQTRMTAMASGFSGRDSLNGIDDNGIRNKIILRDHVCQTHTLLAMHRYASALKMDTKHVYQALPRLLSLWFDLVSVGRDQPEKPSSIQDPLHVLRQNQNHANTFMASQIRDIPSVAFYTAMPQLISRVIHDDPETSLVVKSILQRVLVKFPQQAMWPLAWLKGSKIENREKIGEEIFNGAQKALSKHHKGMSNLIKLSDSLFEFLRALAVHDGPSDRPHANLLAIRPWQSREVELCEFVPPIQAALAITPTSTDHLNSKDHFSRAIPRMRAFSSRVSVMTSKAKPKKLRAYAVPGTYRTPSRSLQAASAKARTKEEVDIGELHFLVKQEAKGDLRKDARVQDLNNVINRLMASNNGEPGASSRRRRRLHLRTFAVTCLSEDIGILEWVPDTDSLRNLVSKSYNPQTSANCPRRRGSRLANFADATLRSHYEMCQNKYFKEGNLTKAASLFEDHCLRPYPPLLYWWFVQKFHDPHAWYEARNRFTLSAAAWSAVGHVIGLGDRHSENILVDTSSGECVHVDFDCIFDKGLNLPRPEVVPFRLTANMLDAFGPTGADGIYTAGLQTAMRTLRANRDTLLSVLEPFLKDPVIDWKRHRGQQKSSSGNATASAVIHTDKQTKEAKRSIQVIDERLQGIYNLRNPNLKKYRRRDRPAEQDDEYSHLVPLPVEGQVQRMIEEATSHENLVQLYVGWMPWV